MYDWSVSYSQDGITPSTINLVNSPEWQDYSIFVRDDEAFILREIRFALIDATLTVIREYNGRSREWIVNHARIAVQGTSIRGNAAVGFIGPMDDRDRHVRRHMILLRTFLEDQDELYLRSIYEDLVQSDEDLDIYQVEWSVLINVNTIRIGGSQKVKVPEWIRSQKATWQIYEYRRPINCAALAIEHYKAPDRTPFQRILERAADLTLRMNWGEYITFDEVGRVMQFFPNHKLIIFSPGQIKVFQESTYVGCNYQHDETKVIYICFDPVQKHYGRANPVSVFKYWGSIGLRDAKFCSKCSTIYRRFSTCNCTDAVIEQAPKAIKKACNVCNQLGCVCEKSCSICLSVKDKTDHRCIIFDRKQLEVFKQATDPEPEGINDKDCPYKLWAYDLEASQKIIEDKYMQIFDDDGNGDFVRLQNGRVKFY